MELPASVMPDASSVTPAPAARTTARDESTELSLPGRKRSPGRPAALSVTTGAVTKPGAERPSIVTGPVMPGSADRREIVPATLKSISSAPGAALACKMADRSDPAPASARLVTENVASSARGSSGSNPGPTP